MADINPSQQAANYFGDPNSQQMACKLCILRVRNYGQLSRPFFHRQLAALDRVDEPAIMLMELLTDNGG